MSKERGSGASAADHIAAIVKSAHPYFIAEKFVLGSTGSIQDWKGFWNDRGSIGPSITAILQANSAFKDCLIARRQIRVPSSKRRTMLQSSVLRFYWHSFQHHAYIFHEKIGLNANQARHLPYNFNGEDPVGKWETIKKQATKSLLGLKKERGETVHQWTKEHPAVYLLGMVEILSEAAPEEEISKGIRDIVGHLQDATYDVRHDIEIWEKKLEVLHTQVVALAAEVLLPQIANFKKIYDGKIFEIR